jgi:hypothetical protein
MDSVAVLITVLFDFGSYFIISTSNIQSFQTFLTNDFSFEDGLA